METTPAPQKKMPSPKTGNWKEFYGSWEGFHKAAEASVGRKLEKVTVYLSKPSSAPIPSQDR
jgi:hypothetical protein